MNTNAKMWGVGIFLLCVMRAAQGQTDSDRLHQPLGGKAGVEIKHESSYEKSQQGTSPPSTSPSRTAARPPIMACPQILAPVCGSNGNTYKNECYAKLAGVSVQHRGDCGNPLPKCTSDAECGGGFSCWHQIPRGPMAGIRGSKEQPGVCWKSEMIERIR